MLLYVCVGVVCVIDPARKSMHVYKYRYCSLDDDDKNDDDIRYK